MILVLLEVGSGFGAEAFPVRSRGYSGKVDECCLVELVLEVGVDDDFLSLLEELDQAA